MGNCTVANIKKGVTGNRKRITFDLTFSASYATGGDSLVTADLVNLFGPEAGIGGINGGNQAVVLDSFDCEPGSAGHIAVLDRANKKVKAFNGTTEIAAATNLAGVTVKAEVLVTAAT